MVSTDVAMPYVGVCAGCGYDLRGLAAEGACPECGMTVARSMAARGFRYTNHRWLQRMRIGGWLFLGASLLILLGNMLPFVDRWLPYGLRSYLYWQCFEVLRVAAIWLVTSPEPRQERANSPQMSRVWARWLCIMSYSAPLVLSCLLRAPLADAWGITDSSRYWIDSIIYLMSSVATVCLLIMMRWYTMRSADTKAARSLEWAAILGGVVAIVSGAGRVLNSIIPIFTYMGLIIPMVALALVCWCAVMWGVGRFAVSVGRAVRGQRPTLRLGKTVAHVVAALVAGGIAGQLAGEVLYIQAQRVPESELGAVLTLVGGAMWQVGAIVGVAALPNRIALFQRGLTRWRRRKGMAQT